MPIYPLAAYLAIQNPQIPTETIPLDELPVESIHEVCGIYFRSVLLKKEMTVIPQHEHDHDHATLVCSGKARAWVDGVYYGDFVAGTPIEIKAGKKHVFQALEPMTRLTCVHDIASAESVKAKGI